MFLLCILDGFGYRTQEYYNAVIKAKKPNLIKLFKSCPNIPIQGSGLSVGLPEGQMGNSEVGHLNFGAGRIVYQDVTRIDKSISDGDFFTNSVLIEGMQLAVRNNSAIHLFGLVSDGCVHSSLKHLEALVKELRTFSSVAVSGGKAIISVVGEGLRHSPGMAARVLSAVGDVDINMISAGASEINISVVVAESAIPVAVRRLHREFFPPEKT